MKSRRYFVSALAAAIAVPAAWIRARVLTCPKCNYEYEEGQVTCSHCGAALPPPAAAAAAPVAAPAPAAPAAGALDESAARQVEALARQAAERGDAAQSLLLARQALALAEAAGAAGMITRLEDLDRTCGNALRIGEQACPVCKGKGKRIMLFASFSGEVQQQTAPNLSCPACNGAGVLRRLATLDRLDKRMADGSRSADTLLRSLRYTDLGGIWVPRDKEEGLRPVDLAALRTSLGRRCPTCYGYGVSGCATCNGAGRAACSGKGCVMGQATCPECGGKRRVNVEENNHTFQRSCPTCKQTGVVTCTTCAGRGWEACAACKGSGELACKTCAGKGQPPICAKCMGRGLTECKSCKGTGDVRGSPCPACRGGRLTLCTTCAGNGRKKR